jgi:hypothetical protein
MLKIKERKLDKIVHDIIKVVGALKQNTDECLTDAMKKKLVQLENELLKIRTELLESVRDSE